VEIAQGIADEVMEDLEELSRYLGRNPGGRGSVEAQALLPQELRALFPNEQLVQLRNWAADVVTGRGLIPVPVLDVVERVEGNRPQKLSQRILTGAADALARIGYGFAPDPRFALCAPKLDEPVVLFDLGEAVAQLEDVSDDYRAALIEAALGSFVAHADGQITESERKVLLTKAMGVDGLSQQEYRRLAANLEWMLTVAPDMTLLRRKLRKIRRKFKKTVPEATARIRSTLVAAAHADGVIHFGKVAAMEKVYEALGLDPDLVYSDLHAGDVGNGPVRVRAAQPGAVGETIPDETPPGPPKLDAARIAAIQSETARASSVLGNIFEDTLEEPEETAADETVPGGLDAKHSHLVNALITQDHWIEEALEELCREAGLLASGAVEAINEWAHETYDEPLLDENDGYKVSPDLAAQLRKKFEEEE
ncbi:MAG: TerB family tellurite resistance protein, partial [Rhodobacteraceae bacterium]|nr:TerB family tellurite resistance protein [Paracoccaceae bacterium]